MGMDLSDVATVDVAETAVVAIPEVGAGLLAKPEETQLEETAVLFGDGRQVVTLGSGILLREVWDQWSNKRVRRRTRRRREPTGSSSTGVSRTGRKR